MYSSITMDGLTQHWGPMVGVLLLLAFSIWWGYHIINGVLRGANTYEADRDDSFIYLVAAGLVYAGAEFIDWDRSFNPPVWVMLAVAATPILIGLWNLVGSLRRRNWTMRMNYFRRWQIFMIFHLLGMGFLIIARS